MFKKISEQKIMVYKGFLYAKIPIMTPQEFKLSFEEKRQAVEAAIQKYLRIHVGSVAVAIVSVGVSGLSGRIAFLPKFAGGVAGGYL